MLWIALRLLGVSLTIGFSSTASAASASPLLPPGHWAVRAVDRLEAVGLLPEWLPAQKSAPLGAVREALSTAESRATELRPDLLPVIRAWRERFAREWPRATTRDMTVLGAHVALGLDGGSTRESTAPAGDLAVARVPLRLEPVRDGVATTGGAAVALTSWLAASANISWDRDEATLDSGELVAAWRGWSLSLGRAHTGFGFSDGGGVMLSGVAPLDRVEVMTTRPVVLPWALRHTGRWTLDTLLVRLDPARHGGGTLWWGTSVRNQLHPRLTLGLQRGILFGGPPWEGFPNYHRAKVLVGLDNYRENNMLTMSARWRLPTEGVQPLTFLLDWGTDDDPLAAYKVPGVVAGVTAPFVASWPVTVGAEWAFFGRTCCRDYDAPWYTHGQYVGGWVDRVGLGDPVGGNARALRLHWTADLWRGRVRAGGAAWRQTRFSTNLHAPYAVGTSLGLRAFAELRLGRGALELRGLHEDGSGWRAAEYGARVTLFF